MGLSHEMKCEVMLKELSKWTLKVQNRITIIITFFIQTGSRKTDLTFSTLGTSRRLAHLLFVYVMARGRVFLSLLVCFTAILFWGGRLHSYARSEILEIWINLYKWQWVWVFMDPGNHLKNKLIFLASLYHPPNIWTF